jgi:hypothetical protein
MMARRYREDADGPDFVPDALQAEYLEEARRTVVASHRRSSRLLRGLQPTSLPGDPHRRLRVLLTLGHGLIGLLILMFAWVTNTWLIGIALLVVTTASLSIGWYLVRRLPVPGAGPDPGRGLDHRASRKP